VALASSARATDMTRNCGRHGAGRVGVCQTWEQLAGGARSPRGLPRVGCAELAMRQKKKAVRSEALGLRGTAARVRTSGPKKTAKTLWIC